ncbi:factor-independent urate hydroxylase [Scopulibacillus cellulosilyticus]|uniref:Factor-independent urate hydroxylase n=1 Tax=Scopulibacillus cellulosilyticus TaxID=2665665 RepID=A0ABW2Q2K7_9BACL
MNIHCSVERIDDMVNNKLNFDLVNQMDRESFTGALGWIFEHSPWVAERSWEKRPFSDVSDLHDAMVGVVDAASYEEKLALLRAHPDLAARVRMANASVKEQSGAGLDKLSKEESEDFLSLNKAYTEKFGFPFILAVRGHTKETIRQSMLKRLQLSPEAEFKEALEQIYKIAGFRLNDFLNNKGGFEMSNQRTMYYGKGDVFVFRTYAKPLEGVKRIPESGFTGRNNVILGTNATIALKGDAFLTSFTEGDNSLIVATDSMKNFMLRHAAKYEGSTLEGFATFVCERFLETYSHIDAVEITCDEIPFDKVEVGGQSGLNESDLVYRHSRNEHATTTVEVKRTANGTEITKQTSGISQLHLIKVSGSSFYGYIKDEYTTLPEAKDRPLFIYLNLDWTYNNVIDAIGSDTSNYVPAEQIRDICATVFNDLENRSIQHLIYEIGLRALERFPQLATIGFESNNKTWEPVVEDIPGSKGQVFTEPRPPYGFQRFIVTREDLEKEGRAASGAAHTAKA